MARTVNGYMILSYRQLANENECVLLILSETIIHFNQLQILK